MKTSRNNIRTIEQYLTGKLGTGETLLFKARLLTDPILCLNLAMQRKTIELVRLFGRREMKTKLEKTHRQLFRNPEKTAFQESILQLFPKL